MMAFVMISYRVFVDPVNCSLEIFNEIVVMIVGYHMVMLINESGLTAATRDQIGLSLITFIALLCLVNSLKFTYDQGRFAIFCFRKLKAQHIRRRNTKRFRKRYR